MRKQDLQREMQTYAQVHGVPIIEAPGLAFLLDQVREVCRAKEELSGPATDLSAQAGDYSRQGDDLSVQGTGLSEQANVHILEVGTAIGYSAINMAWQDPGILIDSIEIDPYIAVEARKNIKKAGLLDRIHLYVMDALMFIPQVRYDLAFIDGAKGQYGRQTEHFIPYMKADGLFIYDDLAFHGITKDPSLTHNRHTRDLVRRLRDFQQQMEEDPRFVLQAYPNLGDGMLLAYLRPPEDKNSK